MKQIYILSRGSQIELTSKNMKTCYDALSDSLRAFEKQYMLSYSQITRRFKKASEYAFQTPAGVTNSIKRYLIFPSYSKFKNFHSN